MVPVPVAGVGAVCVQVPAAQVPEAVVPPAAWPPAGGFVSTMNADQWPLGAWVNVAPAASNVSAVGLPPAEAFCKTPICILVGVMAPLAPLDQVPPPDPWVVTWLKAVTADGPTITFAIRCFDPEVAANATVMVSLEVGTLPAAMTEPQHLNCWLTAPAWVCIAVQVLALLSLML